MWIPVVLEWVPYHRPKFPLLLLNLEERVGAAPIFGSAPPPLLLIQSLLFLFGRNPLSCCNNTPQAKSRRAKHVGFFSTSSPHTAVFLHYHLWMGWPCDVEVPRGAPKTGSHPIQQCPGDPSAPGGGRAQHVSLNPKPTSCGTQNSHSSVNHRT